MPQTKYITKNKYNKYRKRKKKRENAGQKALRMVYKIKDQVNIEVKHADKVALGLRPDWTGAIISFNDFITQGVADVNQRVGDSIKMQTLMLNFGLEQPSVGAFTRIIIFIDKENKILVPADLLPAPLAAEYPFGHKTYDKRFNSVVLYDELFGGSTQGAKEFQVRKLALKLNTHAQYLAGGTTIQTGGLKMFRCSNWDPASDNRSILSYKARLLYTDN